jgi:glycine oxidase
MKTDVVVLGGGIIGCAVAEELARRGQRVVVVERGQIGAEASSAAAGILSAQTDLSKPGPFFDLCQAAREMYPRWVGHLERRSGVRVGYHQDGILYLAMTKRERHMMSQRARWQRRRGLRVERWSPTEIRRREPSLDRTVGTGFFFPREGQVDNVALMQALARACRRAGVRLWERTTVKGLVIRRRAVRGAQTSRGMVDAPVVVNCLGSWANLDGRFPVRIPVVPVRGQMLAFQGPKRLFRRTVMSERAYVVQRRDGRLLIGSTVEFAGFDRSLTVEGISGILSGIRRITTALSRCTFTDAWTGFRPCPKDRQPILGPTSVHGLYAATGHFRHGILLAPVTAALLAELIMGRQPAFDLSSFDPARFDRLG